MWSYEVLLSNKRSRNTFVKAESLFDIILERGAIEAMYKSVFLIDTEELLTNKKIDSIVGKRYAYWIPLDIDKGDSSDEYVLSKVREQVLYLNSLDLHEDNFFIWFSGNGYHIDIHVGCFELEPCEDFPFIIKQTLKKLFTDIDESIYTRTSIIRCPFSLNDKTGMYKIPLSRKELFSLNVTEIHALARDYAKIMQERLDWFIDESENKYGEGELSHAVIKDVPKLRELGNVIEPSNIASCIYRIFSNPPQEGNRNNTIMRLASYFRRVGLPSRVAKSAILDWNNNSLEENIAIQKIEYTYNKGYQYGCQDKILQQHCNTNCKHFKHKDLVLEVHTPDELQKQLMTFLESDYSNRVIDLSAMFGLPKSQDTTIYPGELVTIFGATGVNKSTFVQNLLLGIDFNTGIPNEKFQMPVTYFAPELSARLTHRRNIQILTNSSKGEISNPFNAQKLYNSIKHLISHIKLVTITPTLDQIVASIEELSSQVIIVDYIELINVPGERNEVAKIQQIMQKLANIAVTKDIIVILVSQISRGYAREGRLDIYAGHGSGAIEKSSRKVIGIYGQQEERTRTIEMFKNQDGDLLSVNLEVLPSMRMRRIETHLQKNNI